MRYLTITISETYQVSDEDLNKSLLIEEDLVDMSDEELEDYVADHCPTDVIQDKGSYEHAEVTLDNIETQ
jgi:hypothetical protein